MKISYNWLKNYLDLSIEPRQLGERLSLAGLEVEEVIEKRLDFPGVVVGRVIASEAHPHADKLKICTVDVAEKELSIVCGAPNVAAGQTVPVAKPGTELPNGLKINRTEIRGVHSEGMICSQQELGLTEHSDGIWVLPDNLPPGVPLAKALEFETDFIFDIAVTPNRPDCLSHLGVAREVGALINQKIRKPQISLTESDHRADAEVGIHIQTPEGCPRYSARLIRNIKVGESPTWLVRRLEAVGMRSINNVVDITNFVMMETGQPLHAFDFDRLRGGQIIVREAKKGETFTTLDDNERILPKGTVLICDAERPVAIGGIMGGLNSEVHQDTVNILLESAYFQPESIQRNARFLGLSTEASQRFERGTDPNGTCFALDRASQLIAELCGGQILQSAIDQYPSPKQPLKVPLNVKQINKLLGTDISQKQMSELLARIELKTEDNTVSVPTYRPDIRESADLAEEIARLYGLERIPLKESLKIHYAYSRNQRESFVDNLKNILTGFGLQEVITGSMVNRERWQELTQRQIYPLLNPISRDMDGMRNTLIPSLAQVIQYNQNRQTKDLRVFEINTVFITGADLQKQPGETLTLGIALTGKREGNVWYSPHQSFNFYDIKGIVEGLLHKISLDNWQFISYSDQVIEDGLEIDINDNAIGYLGQLNRRISEGMELEDDVLVAEIEVDPLFINQRSVKSYQPVFRFPWVERDVALVVDEEIEVAELLNTIYQKGEKLLTDVEIFDVYRGKQIPEGKKSMAFRLIFQSPERTLKEEEINNLMNMIISAVSKDYDAKLRE